MSPRDTSNPPPSTNLPPLTTPPDAAQAWQHAPFTGYGIELEHIIVDARTLSVAPIADRLLDAVGGAQDMNVERGDTCWSNELALHVIETKTAGPAFDLVEAGRALRREVDALHALLEPWGARLMPTGMHPWMDPKTETRLWPHQNDVIYRAFDRIFDCKGHGWSNLQSMHVNLPFDSDESFGRLHAACRLVMPLLPSLAASSPYCESQRTSTWDHRLTVYRKNCARVPVVTGRVIPEPVFSIADYQQLLEGLYRGIAVHDPEGILQEEWLNARGAIARFDRGAVEIRVLDTQECPEQDLALASFVTALVQALYEGDWLSAAAQRQWSTDALVAEFDASLLHGTSGELSKDYARALGVSSRSRREALRELLRRLLPMMHPHRGGLELIVTEGNLAERIVRRTQRLTRSRTGRDSLVPSQHPPAPDMLFDVYAQLCDCLQHGGAFVD